MEKELINNTKSFSESQVKLYSLIKKLEKKNGNSLSIADYLDIIVSAGKVLEKEEWVAVTKAVSQAMVDAHMIEQQ